MSTFNAKLDQARRRQKRLYLVAGILVVVILLIVISLFVVSRGTRIEILPIEAREAAEIRVTKGLGFSYGNTVYSLSANPVVSASAPGYRKTEKTIDRAFLGKNFPLELFELPGRLVIEIAGDTEKLTRTGWRINGHDVARAAGFDQELEAGRSTVTIDNPFFQQKELEVELKRGELTRIEVELQPVHGLLDLSSKPSGATVYLDNREVGTTPLQLDQDGGSYSLRLVADNYVDITEEVTVTRTNPEVVRDYNLELKKAKVVFELIPKGGTLLINGVEAEEPFLLQATVEHRLSYSKPGYYSAAQTVILATGEEKRVSFRLKEEKGKVEISSMPRAKVMIDGKDVGQSPVSVTLPAVAHTITFIKQGYRSVSKTIRPQGGKTKKIYTTMLTEYQARLQEAPREFTTANGIKLKLFIVRDTVTMGAPRSEKGQRANEFQKEVLLTKPFYAGLYEITNDQYAKFKPKKGGGGDRPVTKISWTEAAVFCNWLSEKENLRPFYSIVDSRVMGFDPHSEGYRLLSEAEWEWLARKAGKTKQTIFSWGNETVIPPNAANIADESAKGQVRFYVPNYRDGYPVAAPVGSLARESSGLYDMAGNVSEWVHDVYSIVPMQSGITLKNPLGEQRGDAHVVKGANFRSGTLTSLRPSFREGLTAGRDDVGFRIGRYLYGGEHE